MADPHIDNKGKGVGIDEVPRPLIFEKILHTKMLQWKQRERGRLKVVDQTHVAFWMMNRNLNNKPTFLLPIPGLLTFIITLWLEYR